MTQQDQPKKTRSPGLKLSHVLLWIASIVVLMIVIVGIVISVYHEQIADYLDSQTVGLRAYEIDQKHAHERALHHD